MSAFTRPRKLGYSLLALAVAGTLGTAAAQQTAAPAPKVDDANVLDTVVVTAQKRSQSLQEVPISMTVISGEQLEKSRVRTLMDLQQSVPNFEASALLGIQIGRASCRERVCYPV